MIPLATFQAIVWVVFMAAAISAFFMHHELIALMAIVIAAMLPATKRKKARKGTEGWEEKPSQAKTSTES